jgi:hypothetical protein
MTGCDARLTRLAALRGLDPGVLRPAAGGGGPGPGELAELFGLHVSDMYAIAGQDVPDDLAPRDDTGGVTVVLWELIYIPRAAADLGRLIRSLPESAEPRRPRRPKPAHRNYPDGPGALVVRLLENRGLSWTAQAKALFGLGGRPALSGSTIGMIARGNKELIADLLVGFGGAIDIPIGDLGALTGVDVSGDHRPVHPDAAEAARVLWDGRRLTGAQWSEVHRMGHVLRHERAGELDPLMRCGCPGPRG